LIFNAGVANFTGIDWLAALKQIAANFVDGITRPRFNLQTVGEVSVDGLGWVWQSNLFGHYALVRQPVQRLDIDIQTGYTVSRPRAVAQKFCVSC
jgi:NAD(P)-dependent dehydrogenase (short-subunit alcohol dehydrogenase family)